MITIISTVTNNIVNSLFKDYQNRKSAKIFSYQKSSAKAATPLAQTRQINIIY